MTILNLNCNSLKVWVLRFSLFQLWAPYEFSCWSQQISWVLQSWAEQVACPKAQRAAVLAANSVTPRNMASEEKRESARSSTNIEMTEKTERMEGNESCSDLKTPEKRAPLQATFFVRLKSRLRWPGFGHVVKTIVLGLGFNLFDVYSDIGSGLHHDQVKNVNRSFHSSDIVPKHCTVHKNNPIIDDLYYYECIEADTIWAGITFACIQVPSLVLILCGALGTVLLHGCRFEQGSKGRMILGSFLLLLIPFPLLVFTQQVASLFMQDDAQMELLSAIFLFGEGSLEAAPQLLILLYIFISDSERQIPWIQKASIMSSLFTISKTSTELYANEGYSWRGSTISMVLNHRLTLKDSILKSKSLCDKLLIMAKLSPTFILSLAYKVSSIAIIAALLKSYAVIYLVIGIVTTFIVAFKTYDTSVYGIDEKAGGALFYCLTNTTIVAKCPLHNRKINFRQMMAVSVTWMILHTTTLVGLMIWVSILPEYTHLNHWSSHRFVLGHPLIFYPTINGVLFLGPLSILALWGLKKQVVALEQKEGGERILWSTGPRKVPQTRTGTTAP